MIGKGKARAHGNIALIKYWGKKDEEKVIPMNSSLSLTVDCFYTDTELVFDEDIDRDYFYLNGNLQGVDATSRVSRFLDLFRKMTKINAPALVKSINQVPTAAGLASSSSGFAALAAAANLASGLNLNKRELSMLARQGSGSATRSIYGGLVVWQKGASENDSYAVPLDDANWDIGMVIVIVNRNKKAVSSRQGMKRTVETSPFYKEWVESAKEDLEDIKIAIKNRDFEQMGIITERNALKMHATMLGANPPLLYWEPETLLVMQVVEELRSKGIPSYFTMDAGPNVKILCRLSQADLIRKRLEDNFNSLQIIVTGPGPGITAI